MPSNSTYVGNSQALAHLWDDHVDSVVHAQAGRRVVSFVDLVVGLNAAVGANGHSSGFSQRSELLSFVWEIKKIVK